jgi:hypothetical protein
LQARRNVHPPHVYPTPVLKHVDPFLEPIAEKPREELEKYQEAQNAIQKL